MLRSRRSLLLALPAWLCFPRPARAAPVLRLERSGDGVVVLTGEEVVRPLTLPGGDTRLLAPLPCGGELLTAAIFASRNGGVLLEIAAIARHEAGRVVLLGLEPLTWHGQDNSRLRTRLSATGDGSGPEPAS